MYARQVSLLLLLLLSAPPLAAQETLVVTAEGSAPAFACVEADCERLAWLPGGAGVTVIGQAEGRELEGSTLWYEVLLDCPCLDYVQHPLYDVPDTKDPEKNVWREWHPYWSPQGERIATVFGNSLYVWDAASGERLVQAPLDILHSGHMAWSPDGSRIVVGTGISFDDEGQGEVEPERSLLLVNADGTSPMPLPVQAGGVRDVAWSNDGTRIATVGDEVRIWEVQTGKTLLTLAQSAASVAWSPDDQRLAIEYIGEHASVLRVLDAENGIQLFSFLVPDGEHIGDVGWTADGERFTYTTYIVEERANDHKLVTESAVQIRDPDGRDSALKLFVTEDRLLDMDWSPDDRFLVSSRRGGVKILDGQDGHTVATLVAPLSQTLPEWKGGRFFAELVDWSPDGTRIVASAKELGERMREIHATGLVWDLTLIPEGPARAFIHSSQLGSA